MGYWLDTFKDWKSRSAKRISWVGPGYYEKHSYGWVYVGDDAGNSAKFFASEEDFYEQEG